MTVYLRLWGSSWVVDGNGKSLNFTAGMTSTLHPNYVASLGAAIQPVGGGGEGALPIQEQDTADLGNPANWTEADPDGVEISGNDGNVVVHFNVYGTAAITVTIEGSPDRVKTVQPGETWISEPLTLARFTAAVLIHYTSSAGLRLAAIRKTPA